MQNEKDDQDFDLKSISLPLKLNCSRHVIAHRSANARMIENILLVWLDNNTREEIDDICRNTIDKLQYVINMIKIFNDPRQCVEFIEEMKNEKICIIVSGSFGQIIVPQIHELNYVDSIFIFCGNKTYHELWSKEWTKIKGVFTEISPICEALKQIVQQYEQNSLSINFIPINNQNFDQINSSFVFIQIIKEIILNLSFTDKHIKQLCDYYRTTLADNTSKLKSIDIFERKYNEITPIWWYSHASFLHSLINHSLRSNDLNILMKISFFINNLHYQIKQLYKEQSSELDNSFTVYHGQGLLKSTFEHIMKNKNGFISFNNFFCASEDRKISFNFAQRAITNPDLIGIFFIITIDPSKTTEPFAFINNINEFDGKEEVLFSIHTIFRINEIQSMGEKNRLFQIGLTLINENDKEFCLFKNYIQEETYSYLIGWDRLGQWLIKTDQFEKAQKLYEILFEETNDEKDKENYHHHLDTIKDHIITHKKTILSKKNSAKLFSSHPVLNTTYDSLEYGINPFDEHTINSKHNSFSSNQTRFEKFKKNLDFFKKKLTFK